MDEKNHFDLIFCVLACAKNEKYINRLKNFIEKYGYKWKNFNFKIKIVFLVEDEQKPSFINDDFIWYNCPNTPLGLRIINYIKNLKLETKWIMQVDDDSSTDLDKTLELLNQFYDCEDSMVLMGGRNTDLEMGLQFVLRKMKINNFFFDSADVTKFNYVPYFIHAWEPSIFSQKAIKKIKEWDKLEEFEDLCHFYKPVFSDQAPYVLAKIIKIPIVECLFLSPFNSYDEYSAINANGRFSHIHYVLEKDSGYLNLISLLEKSEVIEKKQENLYEFWAYDKIPQRRRFIGILSLKNNGEIGIYNNNNEKFWEKKDGVLYIYTSNKELSSTLWEIESDHFYKGNFIKDSNIIHELIKIK